MTSHLEHVTYYYSLVFKGVKVSCSFCRLKFRSIWYQSDNGFIMGQLSSRPNKAYDECVLEPCTLLDFSRNTAEHHPHWVDETPVGTSEIDGEREEKRRRTRFWKWPALHFPRSAKYDLVQAEKDYENEAGLYRKLSKAPISEVRPAAEEQLKQGVLDKDHICSRYKVGNKLGEGGFGSVYAGARCKDGLEVAVKFSVKMPDMPYIKVPGHPKRLPLEIGLMLMANKGPSVPQIIQLLDWQDDADHCIMVMERPLHCMDMFSFMELQGGSLNEGTARHVMRQVIHAANVCCERGVFHRDIKPENLLVNQDTMEVKLIDFGCGALMKKSAFKVFSGTEGYCPPEAEYNGKYHAKPTTVWSLGVLLFIIVCGGYPTADDLFMIYANIWTSPGLSQECCNMICACLHPQPQKRLVLKKMHLHDWVKVME